MLTPLQSTAKAAPVPAITAITASPRYVLVVEKPFAPASSAQWVLKRTGDQILELIYGGKLIACNIARKGSSRKELRILTRSIVACLNGTPMSWDRADARRSFEAMLPANQNPAAIQVARLLMCSQELSGHLLRDGSLKRVGAPGRRGNGGSPQVDRASVIQFLVSRLII